MDAPKYIIVEMFSGVCTFETTIVFPCFIGHDDMARAMGYKPEKVLAAGFVNVGVDYGEIVVGTYGKSTSLGVESREEDARLIRKALSIED